jgi:hypothetical protein
MDSIWEILFVIVVLGVAIYLLIPWYKRGRDARRKRSFVRGIISIFFYLAFIYAWFIFTFKFIPFMIEYTGSVLLGVLLVFPIIMLLFLPMIFFFNFLNGARGKDIFSRNYQEKK